MSLNYAASLSKYPDKGVLGKEELFETAEKFKEKVIVLAGAIDRAQKIVFITGAGISTSSGIPDFRGPNGVWTLEEKGLEPTINIDFELAKPSYTHFAINAILKSGKSCYIVSQNVDNLHLKSGDLHFSGNTHQFLRKQEIIFRSLFHNQQI
jgi:mono-ADP-ribosyltransferase sirtuin 6